MSCGQSFQVPFFFFNSWSSLLGSPAAFAEGSRFCPCGAFSTSSSYWPEHACITMRVAKSSPEYQTALSKYENQRISFTNGPFSLKLFKFANLLSRSSCASRLCGSATASSRHMWGRWSWKRVLSALFWSRKSLRQSCFLWNQAPLPKQEFTPMKRLCDHFHTCFFFRCVSKPTMTFKFNGDSSEHANVQ